MKCRPLERHHRGERTVSIVQRDLYDGVSVGLNRQYTTRLSNWLADEADSERLFERSVILHEIFQPSLALPLTP